MPWINRQAGSLGADAGDSDSPSPYAEALQRGFKWMRFQGAVETQFQIDTRASHWKRLIVATLIGHASIWFSVINVLPIFPTLHDQMLVNWSLVSLLALILTSACLWLVPRGAARAWHMDMAALPAALASMAGVLWIATATNSFASTLHASNTILIVMWACILCRQRFWFALAISVSTLIASAMVLDGPSPQQQQIVYSTLKILALTTLFAVAANYALEHRERRAYLLRKVEEEQRAALAETSERLMGLSLRDPLTGIFNRRHFDAHLLAAWQRAAASRLPMAVAMIDVDFFKRFNDTYGHPVGDACLGRIAHLLEDVAARHGAIAARLGGEEFALLMPQRSVDDAAGIAERVREGVLGLQIPHIASAVSSHVTVSIGVVTAVPPAASAHDATGIAQLLAQADAMLYEAKAFGRNRVLARMVILEQVDGPARVAVSEAPDSTVVAETRLESSMAERLAELLKTGFQWLRFPREIEAQYQADTDASRRIRLIVSCIGGVLLYIVYSSTNRDLMPDVVHRFGAAQLTVVLFGIALVFFMCLRVKPAFREAAYAFNLLVSSAATLWAFAPSQSLTVYAGFVVLLLIPLFGAVGARLPFWHSSVVTWATFFGFVYTEIRYSPHDVDVIMNVTTVVFTGMVFVVLVSYALDKVERTDYLLGRLEQLQREALAQANSELQQLVMLDPLTGIRNRRKFEVELNKSWAQAEGEPVSLLIADVDFFKPFNDHYGHPAGDACLKRLAATLDELAEREGVLAARLGGEEFGLLLPRKTLAEAERIGQKLCEAVRALAIEHRVSQTARYVTVSVGAACLSVGSATRSADLFSMADSALYAAKSGGRNQVRSSADTDSAEAQHLLGAAT